jgi:site-specific DNA-methyltransferase (adenine-specific)
LEWLSKVPEHSFHAIVTDPPYGVKEYDFDQLAKRGAKGGIWRIPPSYDGHSRAPLPRFTALNTKERAHLIRFFTEWAILAHRALRPGGHLFLASNAFLSQMVYASIIEAGFEFRGEIIRLVRTLRGGDRPKNAEEEFADIASLPRGCYEPWGLFRKPLPNKMKVSDFLREWETGGIRRLPDGRPFADVIVSERTPQSERRIANHPSLKPQSFMRQIVYAALPFGRGIIVDPFAGSGATIAAAEALGISAIGIERYQDFFDLASNAVPSLAHISLKAQNAVIDDNTQEQVYSHPTLFE